MRHYGSQCGQCGQQLNRNVMSASNYGMVLSGAVIGKNGEVINPGRVTYAPSPLEVRIAELEKRVAELEMKT